MFNRQLLLRASSCIIAILVFSAASALAGKVTIRWTSPGDDGFSGQASYYDIRYATFPITASTWHLASIVPNPISPKPPGQQESFDVAGLLNTVEYFFAIKTADEDFNWSPLSNVVKATVPEDELTRGDINLNSIPYEVGDVVMFTEYFTRGLSIFTTNIGEQIAQTDVTVDGSALTVADLTYLIRVVTGDAVPLARLATVGDKVLLEERIESGSYIVDTRSIRSIGAAHLVYDIEGSHDFAAPTFTAADDMTLEYAVLDGQLHVLIYDIGKSRIDPGDHQLFELPLRAGQQLTLATADIADYDGRTIQTARGVSGLPNSFSLSQNYPNPFNPTTQIEFSIPQESEVELVIYNVTGQQVRKLVDGSRRSGVHTVYWDGRNDTGDGVASGVYFYRLRAGSFTDARQMVLLK